MTGRSLVRNGERVASSGSGCVLLRQPAARDHRLGGQMDEPSSPVRVDGREMAATRTGDEEEVLSLRCARGEALTELATGCAMGIPVELIAERVASSGSGCVLLRQPAARDHRLGGQMDEPS